MWVEHGGGVDPQGKMIIVIAVTVRSGEWVLDKQKQQNKVKKT